MYFLYSSSPDGHLGSFHLLTIVSNASMNVDVKLIAFWNRSWPSINVRVNSLYANTQEKVPSCQITPCLSSFSVYTRAFIYRVSRCGNLLGMEQFSGQDASFRDCDFPRGGLSPERLLKHTGEWAGLWVVPFDQALRQKPSHPFFLILDGSLQPQHGFMVVQLHLLGHTDCPPCL